MAVGNAQAHSHIHRSRGAQWGESRREMEIKSTEESGPTEKENQQREQKFIGEAEKKRQNHAWGSPQLQPLS